MSTKVGSDPPTTSDAPPDDCQQLDGFVGIDKFGPLVARLIAEGHPDPWQAAIDAINAREVGYTKEQNERHLADLSARRAEKAEKDLRAKAERDARIAEYNAHWLDLNRVSSSAHTHEVDAALSHALNTRIVTFCLARAREVHRSPRRATATKTASKGGNSEPPGRPRALGIEPQRLARVEELLEHATHEADSRELRDEIDALRDELRAYRATNAAKRWRERRAAA